MSFLRFIERIGKALAVLVFVAFANETYGAIKYVTPTGVGSCTSWADACALTTALNAAVSGDEIWVKAGTYTGPFYLGGPTQAGVKLIGGFAGTETAASQSNPAANPTLLDGGGAARVLECTDNSSATVIRGFTFQNGQAGSDHDGGALRIGLRKVSWTR